MPERVPDDASLMREHAEQAAALCEAGCDLILAETHNTIREARAATCAARATGLPVWSTLVCGQGALLLSGEPLEAAVHALAADGATAVGVNCMTLEHCEQALPVLVRSGVRFGFYPNLHCDPSRPQRAARAVAPEEFVARARVWLDAGAGFVGACCGSEPRHIGALRAVISSDAEPKHVSR
jgi:S-methylmethionine-dependent homocysteine/selenocysteine methylase